MNYGLIGRLILIGMPIPENRNKVLKDLKDEKFIHKNDGGSWDITNYGALMIAADLKLFEGLEKRSVRVIRYSDRSRVSGIGEKIFYSGYAISFEEIIQYILTVIPQEEIMENGIRRQKYSFPETAIRELLANIMVHQALEQRGTSPMVEIFSDRIEFSNAGAPLVAIERIVDTVPLSRNENMAGFMHRCGICEERGSGFDKVIAATCANALIAPKIENQGNRFTRVTLYSRIIRDTVETKLIKAVDPSTAPRYMKYVPFWA